MEAGVSLCGVPSWRLTGMAEDSRRAFESRELVS
jgi:hypothetical protein